MVSERLQRQIDRLLDEAEEAVGKKDWSTALDRAEHVLTLHPENQDAAAFHAAARRGLAAKGHPDSVLGTAAVLPEALTAPEPTRPHPASFVSGRYQVIRFLGEGGKKRVYLAHDTRLDRDVAFALIKTEGLDRAGLDRITREAQAMGKLGDHPHVVPVFDMGEESSHESLPLSGAKGEGVIQPYIVAQYLPGGDVEGLLAHSEGRRLSVDQALRIANQVCQALEHAHSHGIVHRDLKPGNIWLPDQSKVLSPKFKVPPPPTQDPGPRTQDSLLRSGTSGSRSPSTVLALPRLG